jgi:hypothetical protein
MQRIQINTLQKKLCVNLVTYQNHYSCFLVSGSKMCIMINTTRRKLYAVYRCITVTQWAPSMGNPIILLYHCNFLPIKQQKHNPTNMQICATTTKALSIHLSVYMKLHKINVNQNTAKVQTFFTQATSKRRDMRRARCSVRLQLEACHAVWPAANSPEYYNLQQISYVISYIFYT